MPANYPGFIIVKEFRASARPCCTLEVKMHPSHPSLSRINYLSHGLAPIFPDTFYRLTHYWFAAADIPVANDIPVH
ncbi:MAG: hypothetical protein E6503_30515, partial [Klebsiella michiganensis]|nr:hypothetical protein [Klebsiella michiganensis]